MVKSKTFRGLALLTVMMYLMTAIVVGNTAMVDAATDTNAAALARYNGGSTMQNGWEVANPFPISGYAVAEEDKCPNILNDGSESYPSEAYLPMNAIENDIITVCFDFKADRVMNDASFRFLSGKDTVWGMITKADGLYFEGADGNNAFLMTYSENVRYEVKAVFDMDSNVVRTIQINGDTVATNLPFVKENSAIDGFSMKTGVEATGVLINKNFYADKGYYVKEDFMGSGGVMPDDWNVSGSVSLRNKNASAYDKYDLLINGKSAVATAEKSFSPVSGNLRFDISLLQPQKGGSYSITLSGNDTKAVEITSDGTNYYSNSNEGKKSFASYTANVYNTIRLDVNTLSKTADVYFNNMKIRTAIPFDGAAEVIDKISVKAESGCSELYVDDVELSKAVTYAADYPVIGEIPEKNADAPLISMQICPMWTEGQHYGWDYINHSSDDRKPVLGFYDDTSSEQVDWTIKYMKEHGVDFMNICMYPYAPSDSSSIVSQPTASTTRNTGFINAYLNSRYNDQIKFAVFYESSGLDSYGSDYYDDFFNVILPQYIEMYFKHPQYQKIDGRPVFGIYSPNTFFEILDTGNFMDGLTKERRIKNGINKIRTMCKNAGVGDPYLVSYGNSGLANSVSYGFDATTTYGFGGDSNFTVQRAIMQKQMNNYGSQIDFIPAASPIRNDSAWRISQGYKHSGEELEDQLNWITDKFLAGYTPSKAKGQKIINISSWDEYGEGHAVAPTEGNGFMYLDAIRRATTTGGAHTDVVPTTAQKARIGKLYHVNKKAPKVEFTGEDVNTQVYYKNAEKDLTTPIPETVLKSWDFTTNGEDFLMITEPTGCTITQTSDGAQLTPDGETLEKDGYVNPTILLSGIEDIDIGAVTYIKVRMKKNPTSFGGNVYWTSNFFAEMSEGRSAYLNTYEGDGTEFVDYYAPVYECTGWAGKLTALQVATGFVTTSDSITVQSIELLSEPTFEDRLKVVTDEQTAYLDEQVINKDGVLTFPLTVIANIVGADYMSYFGSEERYIIKYGGVMADFTLNEKTAKVNGKEISLECPAYKVNNYPGETVYAPMSLFEALLYDSNISYDEETKTLMAKDDAPKAEALLFEIKGDKFGHYTNVETIYKGKGRITGKAKTTDSQCFKGDISVSAEDARYIEVRCYLEKATSGEIFFITSTDSTWNGSKRIPVKLDAGYNVLKIDTKEISAWTDDITGIRFDPTTEAGVGFSVSSLSFVKEYIEPTPEPDEEEEQPKLDPFKPAYVLENENTISVYGKAEADFAGKQATLMLLDESTDLENVTYEDILYIDQLVLSADGKYSCNFTVDQSVTPENCKLYVRVGERDITSSVTRAVMSTYDVLDCSASVKMDGDMAVGTVTTEELYGFSKEECEFRPMMVFYDADERMLGAVTGESNTSEMKMAVPEGTKTVKFFVWSNVTTWIPLGGGDALEI